LETARELLPGRLRDPESLFVGRPTDMRTELLAALPLLAGRLIAGENSRIRFDLKDQFEREYTDRSFGGKSVVIFGGGKEGGPFCPCWSRMFPRDKQSWAPLDWESAFGKAYGFHPEECNIPVFDPCQRLLFMTCERELAGRPRRAAS
jgi:hypothetical protein